MFPMKKRNITNLTYNNKPKIFYLLLQMRDVHGDNYSQVACFYKDNNEEDSSYRLGIIDPKCLTPASRIKFDIKSRRLLSEDGGELPYYVRNEFEDCWNASVPGLINLKRNEIESPGQWIDL